MLENPFIAGNEDVKERVDAVVFGKEMRTAVKESPTSRVSRRRTPVHAAAEAGATPSRHRGARSTGGEGAHREVSATW